MKKKFPTYFPFHWSFTQERDFESIVFASILKILKKDFWNLFHTMKKQFFFVDSIKIHSYKFNFIQIFYAKY